MMFSLAKAEAGTLWKGTPGLVSRILRCSKVFSLTSFKYSGVFLFLVGLTVKCSLLSGW